MKFKLFVEGKCDKKFLQDYIQFKFDLKLSNESVFKMGGGTGRLDNLHNEFEPFTKNNGYTSLLFLDADKDIENTKKIANDFKKKYNLDFDLFVFPDNKSNGCLEDLLEYIINPAYNKIFSCFENYIDCIKTNVRYTLPDKKAKIYAYVDAVLTGKERDHMDQGEWVFTNDDVWKLDNPALNPLHEFLSKYFLKSISS
jgi:hypothetical protein